jgi:hypothetical protein
VGLGVRRQQRGLDVLQGLIVVLLHHGGRTSVHRLKELGGLFQLISGRCIT